MKQWVTAQNGLSNLRFIETTTPTELDLKDGEVLVKINYVSLNYRDTEVCNGTYGHHDSVQDRAELVPCSDMSATIIATKSHLQPQTRVMSIFNQSHQKGQIQEHDLTTGLGLPLPGVLTEYRIFPAHGLVEIPAHLSDIEACTLPIAAVTAWTSINSFQPINQPVTSGTVLFQGTGGVSISGLQIAKAMGLTTIVTSSTYEKLRKAVELGADHVINYQHEPEWEKTVMKITGGRGADIIFETGGAETLWKSFSCVAFGGLISSIGYLSGKQVGSEGWNVNVMALKRNVTLKGILNGSKERFEEMLSLAYTEDKGIRPVVDRVFDFHRAKEALEYLASGRHFGKVVVKIS